MYICKTLFQSNTQWQYVNTAMIVPDEDFKKYSSFFTLNKADAQKTVSQIISQRKHRDFRKLIVLKDDMVVAYYEFDSNELREGLFSLLE